MSKPLIILDIDETLVHTTDDHFPDLDPQIIHKLCHYEKHHTVYKRPHVDDFLKFCFEHFDVGIWTAAGAGYADWVLSYLLTEEQRKSLIFVHTENRCTQIYSMFAPSSEFEYPFIKVKDLKKIFKRKFNGIRYPRHRILIVDDTPHTYRRNYGNAIPIPSFYCSNSDRFLLKLQGYLITLLNDVQDWRRIEKRNWYK